ncbi:MAG: hypothetical protein AAF502_14775 [Bacteroidota bacterium]
MKTFVNLFSLLILLASWQVGLGQQAFLHTAHSSNINGHITSLNHSSTNNRASAMVFVTPVFGKYNTSAPGVWYNNGKWNIFNEDRAALKNGEKFNIFTFNGPSSTVFEHTATRSNSFGFLSQIQHAAANDPNARVFITQKYGAPGVYNTAPVGVVFTNNQWHIANLDKTAIPFGAKFNIYIVTSSNRNYVSKTFEYTASRPSGHIGNISHQAINNKPGALLMATQVVKGVRPYNGHNIGVWHNGNNWTVYNQDKSAMPVNSKYFILNSASMSNSVMVYPKPTQQEPESILSRFGYNTMKVYGKEARGQRPLLLIMVRYRDINFHGDHNVSYYDNLFFGNGRDETDPSVKTYFSYASHSKFTFRKAGIVQIRYEDLPGTTIDESLLHCAANRSFDEEKLCAGADHPWENILPNAVRLAESQAGFEFSRYDINRDNRITQDELTICIINADVPIGGTNALYPVSFADGGAARGGSTGLENGRRYEGAVISVGEGVGFATIVHELGHLLGAFDLYGAGSRINQRRTIMSGTISGREDDKWSLFIDPYHRMRLGWIKPRVFNMKGAGNSAYLDVANNGGAYITEQKQPILLYDPDRGNEYFLLESRDNRVTGFDNGNDTRGVAVWHIRTKANHAPFDNKVILRGEDGTMQSVKRGDDLAAKDGGTDILELYRGRNNLWDSYLRGDDVEGHDHAIYFCGAPQRDVNLVGRGSCLRETSGAYKLKWYDNSESGVEVKVGRGTSPSGPGKYPVEWSRGGMPAEVTLATPTPVRPGNKLTLKGNFSVKKESRLVKLSNSANAYTLTVESWTARSIIVKLPSNVQPANYKLSIHLNSSGQKPSKPVDVTVAPIMINAPNVEIQNKVIIPNSNIIKNKKPKIDN